MTVVYLILAVLAGGAGGVFLGALRPTPETGTIDFTRPAARGELDLTWEFQPAPRGKRETLLAPDAHSVRVELLERAAEARRRSV